MNRSISIIIPAYNEQIRLPDTLRRIRDYLESSVWSFYEILVVDDGSNDDTFAVAEQFAKTHCRVRVLRNPGNRGKGFSVRHGMLEATGDWRLFSDADLSTPIDELEKLWCVDCPGKLRYRDRLARAGPIADRGPPAGLPRNHRAVL